MQTLFHITTYWILLSITAAGIIATYELIHDLYREWIKGE